MPMTDRGAAQSPSGKPSEVEEAPMSAKTAKPRVTMRERSEQRKQVRIAEMNVAIAEGRLTVRQMTTRERAAGEIRRTAAVKAYAARAKSPRW
jgi:hypothetical protein